MFPVAKEYKKEIKNALPCLGGSYSSATYPELYSVIGFNNGGTFNMTSKGKGDISGYDTYTYSIANKTKFYQWYSINTEKYCIGVRCLRNQSNNSGSQLTVIRCHDKDGNLISDTIVHTPNGSYAYQYLNGVAFFGDEIALSFCGVNANRTRIFKLLYSSDGGKSFVTRIDTNSYKNVDGDQKLTYMTKDYIYTDATSTSASSGSWCMYKIGKTSGSNTLVHENTHTTNGGFRSCRWNITTGHNYSYIVYENLYYLYYVDDNDPTNTISVTGKPSFDPPATDSDWGNAVGGAFIDEKLYITTRPGIDTYICECEFSDPKTISKVRQFKMTTPIGKGGSIRGGFKMGNYVYLSVTGASTNNGFYVCDLINETSAYFNVNDGSSSNPVYSDGRIVTSDSTSVCSIDPVILFKTPNINNLPGTTMYITTKASE